MLNKKIKIFTSLICLSTLFLGIAYATISSTDLNITGYANALASTSVDIISADYLDSVKADSSSRVINATKTIFNTEIVLGIDKDSYITYEIKIKNNTLKDLSFIEVVKNEDFYKTTLDELNDIIIFEINGINKYEKIEPEEEKTFTITFKYKEGITDEEIVNSKNTLNSYLNFRFREVYNISYQDIVNHDYPIIAVDGNDLIIEFIDDIPEDVIVEGEANYSYEEGVLTAENIASDLVIKEKESG